MYPPPSNLKHALPTRQVVTQAVHRGGGAGELSIEEEPSERVASGNTGIIGLLPAGSTKPRSELGKLDLLHGPVML